MIEKRMVAIDLDGTILANYVDIDQRFIEVIRGLIDDEKNKYKIFFCIVTGQIWETASKTYKELLEKVGKSNDKVKLDTYLATYNGAYIKHPLKKDSPTITIPVTNSVIREILDEEIIKNNLLNIMVNVASDLPEGQKAILTSDDEHYKEIYLKGTSPYSKCSKDDFLKNLKDRDCLQLILEFSNDEKKINKIISVLRKRFKSSVSFYFGEKLKTRNPGERVLMPDPTKIIFKIQNCNINKGEAIKFLASFHEVPLQNVIAFGNDINDIKMIEKVGLGVALSNSFNNLKSYAHDITTKSSHEGGVAEYLENYFKKY